MTYEEWALQVPQEIRADALWKMEAYRLAMFLYDLAWEDCERLMRDMRGREVTRQIVRSAGSIAANIEEGFGRGFGKDYAYFLRISLGSARETRGWYYRSRGLLPPAVVEHRIKLLSQITALLVTAAHQQKQNARRQ
jgi:four helix bundle protein